MNNKKIGLDFHGVINTNPEFFRDFADAAIKQNVEVHIISGGPYEYIEKYLHDHNIPYSKIWCIFDFYNHKNKVEFLPDGSFHVDDELWNSSKAQYCKDEGIDIHIDDSQVYGKYFHSGYCRYEAAKKLCIYKNINISFVASPDVVLQQILSLCR